MLFYRISLGEGLIIVNVRGYARRRRFAQGLCAKRRCYCALRKAQRNTLGVGILRKGLVLYPLFALFALFALAKAKAKPRKPRKDHGPRATGRLCRQSSRESQPATQPATQASQPATQPPTQARYAKKLPFLRTCALRKAQSAKHYTKQNAMPLRFYALRFAKNAKQS